jgi:hypothetical protein
MMERFTLPHRAATPAYLTQVSSSSDFPLTIVREMVPRRLTELWVVTNECAVRSAGLIEPNNARLQYNGIEWQRQGDRVYLLHPGRFVFPLTLAMLFDIAPHVAVEDSAPSTSPAPASGIVGR